ncbi:hypothetical protein [Marinifilum sp. D714]|uniref:hypothetical protein n=1 Tax=Marinifilum sp. D714 TaxID=2937523 RepID=UPI0027C8E10D|nr:hypothetical protein [Marinifilum sp. D714]MDQ2178780.1 hypothetical protein [Marinifilum sp. D714]
MSKKRSLDHDLLDSFIYWKTLPNNSILKAFKAYFPNASNVKWRMLGHDMYKVNFSYQEEQVNAIFMNNGKLVKVFSAE